MSPKPAVIGNRITGSQGVTHGRVSGTQAVTLLESEMPSHSHQASASIDDAQFQAPAPDRELANLTPGYAYESDELPSVLFSY